MSMLATPVPILTVELPPFGLVTLQTRFVRFQPEGIGVSVTVYVWKLVMFEKTLVFAAVPSSTRLKFARGLGVAVNGNDVEPSGVACFTIVMDPGKVTASADNDRSWLPPEPSRSINRMWYGEPEIATAEFVGPQSPRVAM